MKTTTPLQLKSVLADCTTFLARYVVPTTPAQHRVAALWIVDTWVWPHNRPRAVPILDIKSAEPACGKSTYVSVLAALVPKPLLASNVTPAVLPRALASDPDYLPLLDEFDNLTSIGADNAREIFSMLNAGYKPGTPFLKTVPPDWHLEPFDVFRHKVIARIDGRLPAATESRTLPLPLQRKLATEKTEAWRESRAEPVVKPLRRRLAALAKRIAPKLDDTEVDGLDELSDRQAEISERLTAIADLAGPEIGAQARLDLIELFGHVGAGEESSSLGTRLLADIRATFSGEGVKRISSKDLARELNEIEDAPWQRFGDDGIDALDLARRLKPYGIHPHPLRINGTPVKGYDRADFRNAFKRYLNGAGPLSQSGNGRLHGYTEADDRNRVTASNRHRRVGEPASRAPIKSKRAKS